MNDILLKKCKLSSFNSNESNPERKQSYKMAYRI